MRIGIDVGRATTTAALADATGRVVAEAVVDSAPRTAVCLRRVLAALGPLPGPVGAVAVVTDLARRPPRPRPVAVLRIAPSCHPALAPLADWPEAARAAVGAMTAVVGGGSAVTGRPLAPLDRAAVSAFAARARDAGLSVFAVCAAGAPARPEPELEAAAVLAAAVPGATLSLSYEIGSAGLRERENATVVNAALGGWAEELVADCRTALRSAGVSAPLFFARDDGGLVSAEYFRRHPVIATAPAAACGARGALARAGFTPAGSTPAGLTPPGLTPAGHASAGLTPSRLGPAGLTPSRLAPAGPAPVGLGHAVVIDAGARSVRCLVVRDGEPERTRVPVPGPLGVRLALGAPDIVEIVGESPAGSVAAQAARLRERLPGSATLYTGGAAESVGAPPADAATRAARLTDAARYAARAECRVELEQVVSAAGRAELDQLLAAARDHALSRCVAAGAAPDSVRVEGLAHAPVAYLPAGVHRVTVRAAGEPVAGAVR
ncbi:hydantoinase/oxoprolinase family protein [Streptomyces sp. NPDC056169]|uniref:hydantoinase/oxoprolinase family protein n=1 Tax=Streptomyces sp. NPDC056169 TaxID=3345734 RepID=UPI0035E23377